MPIIAGIVASSKTGHLQPLAPTIGTATDGGTGSTVSVTFTPAATGPTATSFTATSTPGSFTATGASSPLTVSGLTAGTAYTFTVYATNAAGNSPQSAASNSVTPAVPSSFYSIATITPSNGTTSITFSSIPQTYKSLQVRILYKDTSTNEGAQSFTAKNCNIYVNESSGYTCSSHTLGGNGTTVSATGQSSVSVCSMIGMYVGTVTGGTNTYGVAILDIIDYTSTTKNKTLRYIAGSNINTTSTNYGIYLGSALAQTTDAITSLKFGAPGSAMATGTTFALYGVK